MGFVLGTFYLVVAYLGTVTVFGSIATVVHIELILAALVAIVSLPSLPGSYLAKTPQTLALLGLALAVFMSVLMTGWRTGAALAFLGFIPCAFAYFIVCLHCNSQKKLRILALMLLFVCLFVIVHGSIDLARGVVVVDQADPGSTGSPYFLAQRSDSGGWFLRLRGQNFINDPNDFAQLIVTVIPLAFIFWRPKKWFRNFLFVIVPEGILLFGAYLTHSRGFVIALLAVTVLAGRRFIGAIPSLIIAGGMFAAVMALGFTGGREISASAGMGRMALWGDALGLLKAHPLFGVGYGRMADSAGLTAHNSVAVCAAELGLTGLFFWAMFILPSIRDVLSISSPANVSEGEPIIPEEEVFPQTSRTIKPIDKAEVIRLGRLMLLSLAGFLVAGMFLSRAYVVTLFLLGGMVEVVYEMALDRGMIAPRLPLARIVLYSAGLMVLLVLMIYFMLRISNLMR
jgi:hypothetical protein